MIRIRISPDSIDPAETASLQSHGNNVFGFEDLPNNVTPFSDNDYNDVVFS